MSKLLAILLFPVCCFAQIGVEAPILYQQQVASGGAAGDLIDGTHPDYRWDYHSLASGQFSDWVDMTNGVILRQGAPVLQLTNGLTTGVYYPNANGHGLTNVSPFSIGTTYSMVWIVQVGVAVTHAFNLGSDTAVNNGFGMGGVVANPMRFDAFSGGTDHNVNAIRDTITNLVCYVFTAGAGTLYTNNIAISGTTAGPSSWTFNEIGSDSFNENALMNQKALLIYDKAISTTDISNIWYQVHTIGF